ncbi:MAG: hypothetical protein JOS17DRAFT_743677 [Linnemannia elongata]|nr:MAG: hypothetical protein JOS17DRAFT_743677 [Linnemannia elongata]
MIVCLFVSSHFIPLTSSSRSLCFFYYREENVIKYRQTHESGVCLLPSLAVSHALLLFFCIFWPLLHATSV